MALFTSYFCRCHRLSDTRDDRRLCRYASALVSSAALGLLAGCATSGSQATFFDYSTPSAQTATMADAKPKGPTETPKARSVSALLGPYRTGAGYEVQPDVISDGRYNTYTFATGAGSYALPSDGLARQHIQDLLALDALRKRSRAGEFFQGAQGAVTKPLVAVYHTVTDPVGATQTGYSNVKRKVRSVRRGVSNAGEFVTTLGHHEKKQPDREDDSLLEKLIGVAKAKRRLAEQLKVDPYTHYVPLARELDKVAAYSAVGGFGVDKAIGFVPGVGGAIISGLGTLDSVTDRTLDLDPGESAQVNRERLEALRVPEKTIKDLLLSDKLTPTEKTQIVGHLTSLSGTSGLPGLASFVATSDSRRDAFAASQALAYIASHLAESGHITDVRVLGGIPVVMIGDSRTVAVLTADTLSWTAPNSNQLTKLTLLVSGSGKGHGDKEMHISGEASPLVSSELQRLGWAVKANSFASAP